MQTIKKVKVARTNLSTRRTCLRSHVRLDKLNNFAFPFCFVFNERLELVETPIVEPSVESPAFANLSDSFKVFHYNNVSIADNSLAYNMVVVPREAFLPATQSLKQPLGRFCAFALQPFTQVVESFDLSFGSLEYNSLACHSEVVYSDINTQNPVATRSRSVDVSGKSYVKKQSSFPIFNDFKILVIPIKVFPIVFWNRDWKILPFAFYKSSQSYFLKRESKKISIETNGTRFQNRLLLELSRFKIFRSLCDSFTSKVSRKPLSQILVDKVVKLESVAYFGFKTFINSILNSLKKGVGHIKKLFADRNFQFYSGNSIHKLNVEQLIYKSYAGRCPVLMEVSANSPHG